MKEFLQLLSPEAGPRKTAAAAITALHFIRRDRVSAVMADKALRSVASVVMQCHSNRTIFARNRFTAGFADKSP